MNYSKIYNQFIENRKLLTPSGYFEKHHIIPKSLGGSDNESNIIKLSASDHLFAHGLLARIYKGKMIFALKMMLNRKDSLNINKSDRLHYKFSKDNLFFSKEHRNKISLSNRGKKRTPEQNEKNSKARIGNKLSEQHRENISNSLRGKKRADFTDEHRMNLSNSRKGKKATEDTKKKISKLHKGKTTSDDTKLKMSKAAKGRVSSMKGKKHSEETRRKMSESARNRKK